MTKSGTNNWHGSGFEFLRNTALDARNFFSPERSFFRQNQFGGTVGGPIQEESIVLFWRLSGYPAKPGSGYRTNPGSILCKSKRRSERLRSFFDRVRRRPLSRRLVKPEAWVSGFYRHALLHTRMRVEYPVRFSKCCYPAACLVGPDESSDAVHSQAQLRQLNSSRPVHKAKFYATIKAASGSMPTPSVSGRCPATTTLTIIIWIILIPWARAAPVCPASTR